MSLVSGVYLPAGVGVEPEPVFIDSENYESIQQHVGGVFDVIRMDVPAQNGETGVLLGYIHDESLILGMEYNYLATALFRRELHGGCVVLWGNNPNGAYDGDVYDLPAEVTEQITHKLVEYTAGVYNEAAVMELAFQYAVSQGVVTEEEYEVMLEAMAEANLMGVTGNGRLTGEAKATYDKVMDYLKDEVIKMELADMLREENGEDNA